MVVKPQQYLLKIQELLWGLRPSKQICDEHTLPQVLEQVERLTHKAPKTVTADRDHKGIQNGGSTKIQIPKPPLKKDKPYQKCKKRKYHRTRAAMEPIISHQYHINITS